MLWECFSWASRNGVAQMSYLTWIRIRFTFWLICGSMFFIMLRWVEVSKMTDVFSAKLWTLLLIFVGFETEPENLKIKDKLQIRYFESFIFWSKFGIFGTVIGLFFSEFTFKFFAVGQQLSLTFLFNFRTIKKTFYGPDSYKGFPPHPDQQIATVILLHWFSQIHFINNEDTVLWNWIFFQQ